MPNRTLMVVAAAVLLSGCGSSAATPTPEPIAVTVPTIMIPTLPPIPTPDTFTGVQPPGPDFGKATRQRQEVDARPSEEPAGATPAAQPAQTEAAAEQPAPSAQADVATTAAIFPLAADAADVRNLAGDGTMMNYSSKLSADEIMDFYRKELGAGGAAERELLTVKTGDVFSMVFDNWPSANGKAVVVQGTPIAPGTMNINIRLEAV